MTDVKRETANWNRCLPFHACRLIRLKMKKIKKLKIRVNVAAINNGPLTTNN